MTIQDAGTENSKDTRYCYRVWRRWDDSLPRIGFILLHPPMAESVGGLVDRCVSQAVAQDYGAIEVAYLYPRRAFDASHLGRPSDSVDDANKALGAILDLFDRTALVVAAWGIDPSGPARAEDIKSRLSQFGYRNSLHHFGFNKDGSPKGVDQLRGRTKPKRWSL